MKATLTATGLAGIITAAAAAGLPAVAILGIIVLIVLGAGCWVIANRDRTTNAVALITASRGVPIDLDPAHEMTEQSNRSLARPSSSGGRGRRRARGRR